MGLVQRRGAKSGVDFRSVGDHVGAIPDTSAVF